MWSGCAKLVLTCSQLMIGLHIWSSLESYEVLGLFGTFFSFKTRVPLTYEAIQVGSLEISSLKISLRTSNIPASTGKQLVYPLVYKDTKTNVCL